MAERKKVKNILKSEEVDYVTTVKGWVRTFRNNQFIALSDGSTVKTLQVVVDRDNTDADLLKRINTGSAVSLSLIHI